MKISAEEAITKMKIKIAAAALIALTSLAITGLSNAGVNPGDTITADQADKVADLVSPGNLLLVRQGMTMKIIPTERLEWPPPYKAATEKYHAQVQLAPDGSLKGYAAGLPFPDRPERCRGRRSPRGVPRGGAARFSSAGCGTAGCPRSARFPIWSPFPPEILRRIPRRTLSLAWTPLPADSRRFLRTTGLGHSQWPCRGRKMNGKKRPVSSRDESE